MGFKNPISTGIGFATDIFSLGSGSEDEKKLKKDNDAVTRLKKES